MNHTDEIDLFDLIDDIKDQWQWLVGVGFIVTLAALLYAFLATPTYETEVVFKPVREADLLPLNQPRLKDVLGAGEKGVFLTSKQAFDDIRSRALSSNNEHRFYQELLKGESVELKAMIENPKLTPEQNFIKFSERFSHVDPGAKDSDVFLRLKFQLADAKLAAQVLNHYSQFLVTEHANEVRASVQMRIQAQLDYWQMQAGELRSAYEADKQQRLFKLYEAAAIADSIGQSRPLYSADRVAVGVEPPLFMLGSRALRAEITQIEGRKKANEDSYIKGLPELLAKIKVAESAKINWERVRFAEQEQPASTPLAPIKPKKLLIVAIGVVLGGMLGVMLAILRAAWLRRVERKKAERRESSLESGAD